MVNWLEKLTIDDQLAHDLNWEIYQEDKRNPRIGYHKGLYHYEPYKINPHRAYNSRKDNIVAIGMKQFYMSRDETSGRLHSNVTGLSSRIFPALRIKGKPLVGYDIANSQPFFCWITSKKRETLPLSSLKTPFPPLKLPSYPTNPSSLTSNPTYLSNQ
jgi:hypothetical protein